MMKSLFQWKIKHCWTLFDFRNYEKQNIEWLVIAFWIKSKEDDYTETIKMKYTVQNDNEEHDMFRFQYSWCIWRSTQDNP